MKKVKKILMGVVALVLVAACNEGIDPISKVVPGADESAPAVIINYPVEGTLIRVKETVAPIIIRFEATDDIEIKTVSVKLDGTEIANFSEFTDYRRALKEYQHTLTNGSHTLTITASDLSGKSTSKSVTFEKVAPYQPKFSGEIFYMPFDGDYLELVSIKEATKVGSPSFSNVAKAGLKSYAGATDAYLTFPTAGLLGNEFSTTFWYKLNSSPDRSGILTIGPPDLANPSAPNNRKNGFRFFREGSPTSQTFKLNVGEGGGDWWFDGGAAASIDPTATTGWIHIAFTISEGEVVVYINGEIVSQGSGFPGVSWTGCDILSIATGAPRFIEWGHLSDQSFMDELRLFNKALTQVEVKATMN